MSFVPIFIISAPSGTGKTSLLKKFFETAPAEFVLSISHTTRQPRMGEVPGQAYHFISQAEFDTLQQQGGMLESANVFGNSYGTAKLWVEQQLQQGNKVVLEIDVQGALQVMQKRPDACSIFIFPPSLAVLKQRLLDRNTESAETLTRRFKDAKKELKEAPNFDYWLINDDFDAAFKQFSQFLLGGGAEDYQQPTIAADLQALFKPTNLELDSC